MYNVKLKFFDGLNDFLDTKLREKSFPFSFYNRRSVKDLVESFGIPHVEVDLILVNERSEDFSYIVCNGDEIKVYQDSEKICIKKKKSLLPLKLKEIKFVCDVHLWKLARRLRLLGFDVNYERNRENGQLAEISEREDRILLTRDRHLLMRKNITRGVFIRSENSDQQVIETIKSLNIKDDCRPFSRCILCNGKLEKLDMNEENFKKLENKIPASVTVRCDEYKICVLCEKIFWKGSHYKKLSEFVNRVLSLD